MISIINAKDQQDRLLAVLADPTRRRIIELLSVSPMTATALHDSFPIANPAVSRHLRVLREAGVIAEQRVAEDGRIRRYVLQPASLDPLADWIAGLGRTWQAQLDSFRDYVHVRSPRDAKAK